MIQESTKIVDKKKTVVFKTKGIMTVVEIGGRPVDMLFGNWLEAKMELESQGFKVQVKKL